MNKILFAGGLAALSAASLQAQYAPGLTPLEMSKAWSASVDVRGFYDDNFLTEPASFPNGHGGYAHPLSSWGTEISPSAAVNYSEENTLLTASYIYGLNYYENQSVTDQSHQFNARVDHEFSERFKLAVSDFFVVAQEPTVVDPAVISTPLRIEGNNIHNVGQMDFTAGLTKDFDLHLGYANSVYAYQQIGRSVVGYGHDMLLDSGTLVPPNPSYSALLDRMDQTGTLDLRWKATHETTGIFGYRFEHVDYTSPEYIIFPTGTYGNYLPPGYGAFQGSAKGYHANIRNTDDHFVFIGADESFTPNLTGSIRAGAEYLDYYNEHTSELSPYVDASLTDQYMAGCSAQIGVKHIHNSTDVAGTISGGKGAPVPVMDEETTAIYVSDSP